MFATTPPPAGFESKRPLPESAQRRFEVAARAVEIMNATVPYIPEQVIIDSVAPPVSTVPQLEPTPMNEPVTPFETDGKTLDIAALQQMVEDIHAQKNN